METSFLLKRLHVVIVRTHCVRSVQVKSNLYHICPGSKRSAWCFSVADCSCGSFQFKALFLHADFTHDTKLGVFFFFSLSLFSNGQSGTLGKRPEKFNVQNSSLITVSVAGLNKHPQSKSFILVLIISGQEVKDVLNCFEWNYEACELMCVISREREREETECCHKRLFLS